EPGLKFFEVLETVERAAENEKRPFLADHFDGCGDRTGQSSLFELVEVRRQRVCRHKPFSPLSNLIKAHIRSKKQLPSETDYIIRLFIATFIGVNSDASSGPFPLGYRTRCGTGNSRFIFGDACRPHH
ncbi:MAG: hypothetical protein HOQ20_00035, partial [Bradyrhizobium sp.]|nr:hypothetical protein [Bradyrhizobium sp.]